MKTKLFSLFVALFATTALWAYDFKSGDLYYNITSSSDKTVEVTYQDAFNPNNYAELTYTTIPASVTYYGTTYSVTRIGSSAFSCCTGLTSITIPNSVTSIGENAFTYCSSLTSITIPNKVTSIEYQTFFGCSNLTSITIPNSVTSIGWEAFDGTLWYGNQPDGTIYINNILYNYKGKMPDNTSIIVENGTTSISAHAFSGCTGLTSITIPNSVTSIGNDAFTYCSSLTSITIPNSVTSIGSSAFTYCSSLTSITIPNSVASIETWTFRGSGLTSVTIPNSVTSIGESAFSDCTGLTSVTIGNGVTDIGNYAFSGCNGIVSLTIGNSVTSIGGATFSDCSGLTSITIPNSVTSIGNSAFSGCTGLTSITIPNSVTSIGNYAFSGCTSLTSITISNSVTSIGNYAFSGCTGLPSVTIPNSVTSIGESAFSDCTGLTSVTIGNGVTSIKNSAFFGCTGLTSVKWNTKSCEDFSYNNAPFYDIRSQITSFTLGESVVSIPTYLCYGMEKLTSVTIPNSVTSIGSSAFSGCSGLTSITIPNSVTSIGGAAFSGCTGLTSITIPNSVTSIGNYAFSGCTGLTSITIPNSVTSIGGSAFYDCTGLTSITIPNSVTSIGGGAFKGCTGLTSVVWNAKSCEDFSYSEYAPFYDIRSQITSFTFGDAVDSIPAYLCYGMEKLTSVTFRSNVTSIGNEAFTKYSLDSIFIGSGVSSVGGICVLSKNVSSLTSIIVDEDNLTYDSRDSCNAIIETKTNTLLFGCRKTIIPNTITAIANDAFYGNHSRSITIPASVTRIGTGAFGYGYGIDTLYLLSENPPALTNNDLGFNDDYYGRYYSNPILYVPCGTRGAYTNAAGWNRFYDKNIAEPLPQYTIAVRTQNSSQGTASVTQANLCNNDNAIISATPKFGYQFSQWSDSSTDNPYTVEVTQDTTLTAMFVLSQNGKCGDNTTWEYAQSTLRIMGTGSMYSYAESEVPWRLLRDSIVEVEIADEVTSISSYAFRNCKNLVKITFPADLTSMGKLVLGGCTSLTSVVWNVKSIADYSSDNTPFYYYYSYSSSDNFDLRQQITSFAFGKEVESIPAYLCKNMENITSVIIPNSVTTIGNYAFSGSTALSSATMGNSVTTIGNYAFDGCTELLTMLIPNSITTIGEYAFRGCKNMETISLGAGLTSMGDYALDGCQSIYEMTCYAIKVPTVSSNTFREVSTRADLYVPSVSVKKYKTHAYWGVFNVLSIGADPVSSGGSVTVRPGENDVIVTWPTDDNADTYTIQITKDGQVFCTLVFNADGQLTNIAFAPARNGAAHSNPRAILTQAGYRFTVTGLSSGTHYAYDLTVKDYDENILQSYTGTFTTKGENITTDLDNVEGSDPNGDNLNGNGTPRKVFRDGQVYILRDGKTYTVTGVEVE